MTWVTDSGRQLHILRCTHMGIAVDTDCLGKDKILLFHEASKPLLDLLMQLFASTLFHS